MGRLRSEVAEMGWVASSALGCLLLAVPSMARVVFDGRVVRQLPMEASEGGGGGAPGSSAPTHYWPHPTGIRPLLALLVDFSDSPANFQTAEVDSFLNQPGYRRFGNNGSVRDFYLDASRGKLDLRYKVKGYYRAKKPKSYYENVGQYKGGDELATEAIMAMDSQVDYAAYAIPGETSLNSIAILYAGAEHEGDLWGVTTTLDLRVDGKRVGRAYWANIGESEMALSTACHEMGHMLFNWPDLYEVPTNGVEAHCLMGAYASETNPPLPNEALRVDQGWSDAEDLTQASRGRFKVPANGDKAFRFVNPDNPVEAFFVVNRKNTGRYGSLGGRGILIFHFDMRWNETGDREEAAVMLVPSLGRVRAPAHWAEPAWYFYQESMEEFSDAKQADANRWHDGSRSGIRLWDFSPIADTMSFSMGDITSGVALRNVQACPGPPGRGPRFDLKGAKYGAPRLQGEGHPPASILFPAR